MSNRFTHRLYRAYLRGPSHPCKGRFLRWVERILFAEQGLPFEAHGGIRLYLRPWDQVEHLLLAGGQYQASLNEFMGRNLRHGDTVAIAGISFGQQIILASQAVGPGGCVVGIDPSPNALFRARMNCSLNRHTNNVRLVSAGLGENREILALGGTSIGSVSAGSFIKTEGELPFYVFVETLPHILQNLQIKKIDMLFLDVIGFEISVLKGIGDATILPNVITVAIHPWALEKTKTALEDYTGILTTLGYSCSTLEGMPPPESAEALRGCQLVAVRNSAPSPRWLEKGVPGAHPPSNDWDRWRN